MANPTTNFGWQMPTSSDLVTDLPADFEVFGQAVDTALMDLKGGTTGQVLKKNTNTDMDFVWAADSAGMTNPMTTTGDMIYSSSGSTPARLGIGTSGQVVGIAAGVPAWVTPVAGGMTELATGSLSTNITTISGISGSYKDLVIRLDDVVTNADGGIYIRFNSDSASNYLYSYTNSKSGTVSSSGLGDTGLLVLPTLNSTATEVQIMTTVYNYASSATYKVANWNSVGLHPISSPIVTSFDGGGGYKATTAITSVSIKAESTNTLTGTYYIYGVN